jgi:hypothetical protein
MTKQEALIQLAEIANQLPSEILDIAMECIQESITAEELKSDLSNNFEGVPI